jgi:hypothetical protein
VGAWAGVEQGQIQRTWEVTLTELVLDKHVADSCNSGNLLIPKNINLFLHFAYFFGPTSME